MGILSEGVWDEDKLAGFDLPLCSAGLDPDATPEELDLSAAWLTWGTYGDDYYPLRVRAPPRPGRGARLHTARLSACMPVDGERSPVPVNAMERGLADLWARTAGPMTPERAAHLPDGGGHDERRAGCGN